MSVIKSGLFIEIADRLAKQARILDIAAGDAQAEGGGLFYPRIHSNIPPAGDIDVENDLIKSASDLDGDIATTDILNIVYSDFMTAIRRHVVRAGGVASLDKYLLNTTPSGINVDDGFALAYLGVAGSELLQNNVFGPETNIADFAFTSSGVATLTNDNAVGTGSPTVLHTDTASSGFPTGKHAAAKMNIFVASGLGSPDIAVVSLVMDFEGPQTAASGLTVTFSGSEVMVVGTSKTIGTDTDYFIDLCAGNVAGGASGLALQIKSSQERTVSL